MNPLPTAPVVVDEGVAGAPIVNDQPAPPQEDVADEVDYWVIDSDEEDEPTVMFPPLTHVLH